MFKQFEVKQLAVWALIVILSGCSTVGNDVHNVTPSRDVSIVKGSFNREGPFTWMSFSLYEINGQKIPYGFVSAPPPVKLVPGQHVIVALASFNNGIGAPSEAKVPLLVDLKGGTLYEIGGMVSGTHVEAWLQDAVSKEKLSPSFLAPWHRTYQAPTVIKVPAR